MEAAAASLSIAALVEPLPARPLIVPLETSPTSTPDPTPLADPSPYLNPATAPSPATAPNTDPSPAKDPNRATDPSPAKDPNPASGAHSPPAAPTFQLPATPSLLPAAAPAVQPAVRFGAAPERPTYRFTDDEKMQLMNLPKRECTLTRGTRMGGHAPSHHRVRLMSFPPSFAVPHPHSRRLPRPPPPCSPQTWSRIRVRSTSAWWTSCLRTRTTTAPLKASATPSLRGPCASSARRSPPSRSLRPSPKSPPAACGGRWPFLCTGTGA